MVLEDFKFQPRRLAIVNHKNLDSVRLSAFKADFFMRDAFAATLAEDFMLIAPVINQFTLLGTCAGV